MNFASDNASAVAPEIMQAIAQTSEGYALGYGNDEVTRAVEAKIRQVFEAPEARVFLVGTGTAANSIALGCLCPPWGQVWCHEEAHIERDECNAPEFYMGGAKLSLLPGRDAKIGTETLRAALAKAEPGVVHAAQPGALSLTQATEAGAVYTAAEVADLARLAHDLDIPVHMDGTRFSNAIARTKASPAEMSWKAGVDILCLGATKCGALAAEAVILFDPAKAWEFQLRRKRGGHLFSKMRFVSAQMLAWLEDGLWLGLAGHANAMADRLAEGLEAAGVDVTNSVEANLVFARISREQHDALKAAGAQFYVWGKGEGPLLIRLVTSFSTTEEDVDRFCAVLG